MGREISLFTDYHSNENNLTNYCGLLMKMLYEESPRRFEEFLDTIIKSEKNINIIPLFRQQTRQFSSIPDLAITQNSFSIFFETKLRGWSYEQDQIINHMNGFKPNTNTKVLILLSNFEEDDPNTKFKVAISEAKKDNIILQTLTFEDLVGSLEKICVTDNLINMLDEFKIYLDRNKYWPSWKYMLDVVNCGQSLQEVKNGAYMCPDIGKPYSHRRAKYFGSYTNKKVSAIYQIKAIVVIDKNLSDAKIKWKNVNETAEIHKNPNPEKIAQNGL